MLGLYEKELQSVIPLHLAAHLSSEIYDAPRWFPAISPSLVKKPDGQAENMVVGVYYIVIIKFIDFATKICLLL